VKSFVAIVILFSIRSNLTTSLHIIQYIEVGLIHYICEWKLKSESLCSKFQSFPAVQKF